MQRSAVQRSAKTVNDTLQKQGKITKPPEGYCRKDEKAAKYAFFFVTAKRVKVYVDV